MHAHCEGEILDPRKVNRLVPEACATIVARAMAKRPGDRYQSSDEFLADLEAVYSTLSGAGIALPSRSWGGESVTQPSTAHNPRRTRLATAVAIAIVVLGIGLAAVWWGRPNDVANLGDGLDAKQASPLAGAPRGEPIKVGILHSLTGTMAVSGSSAVDATMLAIDEINQSGGVLGRPVEAIVRDGRSDPEFNAQQAEQLITRDHVVIIFGCWMSSGRRAVVPIVERHNNLLVYPRSYEGIEESPNVFYLGATPNQQVTPAIEWAHEALKKRRFFIVGSDYVFPRIAAEAMKDEFKRLGAELAGEVYRPLGSEAFEPVVAEIAAAKPDCILNAISGDSNIAFFRALRASGIGAKDLPTISFCIGEEELRHLNVFQMEGDFAASGYFQTIDSQENRNFVAKFRAKFGPQRVVTDPMEAAYMGVKLWASSVNEARNLDMSAVRQAMRGKRLPSPSGGMRIDSSTQHVYKTPRIGRITDEGQFEVIWTSAESVKPEPYPVERSAQEWLAVLHDLNRSWNGKWEAPTD
jgi:urea transport system substrate-binding protein